MNGLVVPSPCPPAGRTVRENRHPASNYGNLTRMPITFFHLITERRFDFRRNDCVASAMGCSSPIRDSHRPTKIPIPTGGLMLEAQFMESSRRARIPRAVDFDIAIYHTIPVYSRLQSRMCFCCFVTCPSGIVRGPARTIIAMFVGGGRPVSKGGE